MDALAFSHLVSEQVEQLEALGHMCPTHDYGVTFERGTKILFGDREHYHISGTASIDRTGEIMHRGDAVAQVKQAMINLSALLQPHGYDINDLAYLIVYVRNFGDWPSIKAVLDSTLEMALPLIPVHGAVCRPGWLVELEGEAVVTAHNKFPDFL